MYISFWKRKKTTVFNKWNQMDSSKSTWEGDPLQKEKWENSDFQIPLPWSHTHS